MRKALLVVSVVLLAFMIGCSQIDPEITVANKRFGEVSRDVREFVTPASVKQYDDVDDAWRALENGYDYSVDNWFIGDQLGQRIPGGKDTWLLPVETQYLIDTYPSSHSMDCEDGSAWLTSALKKLGYDAWFCVGTIDIDGTSYGHAWCMVQTNNSWSTYETTADEIKAGLPAIYSLAWRTNGVITWRNVWVGAPDVIDPLPLELIKRLKEELRML